MEEMIAAAKWIGAFILLPWLVVAVVGAHLPDSLTLLRHAPWEVWELTPGVSVPLILLAAIYLSGLRVTRSRGGRPAALRQAAFFGGLIAIYAALQSPIESLADHSLAFHQVEHMLLRSVAPALIVLAEPQAVLLRGLPGWLRRGLVSPVLGSRGVRVTFGLLARPLPATLLFIGATVFWMLPRYHDIALLNETVHETWHASLLLSGLIFFWRLFDPRPEPYGASFGARLAMIWGAEMGNILLGFVLTYQSVPLYAAYQKLGLFWGVSPLMNQVYGGQTMWVCGTMMIALSGLVVIYRRGREEERGRHIAGDIALLRDDPAAYFARQQARNRRAALGLSAFIFLVLTVMALSVSAYEVTFHKDRGTSASGAIWNNQIP